jgi:hypothetical protein
MRHDARNLAKKRAAAAMSHLASAVDASLKKQAGEADETNPQSGIDPASNSLRTAGEPGGKIQL